MKPKDKIREIARGLFGGSADICTSLGESPKIHIGIVENGIVKERLTPSFMPMQLYSFLLGIVWAKEKNL